MFKHQIRVPYRDVTAGNHVYYARYLDLLEVARNEVFRQLGHPLLALQERNIIFPVVECNLRYHAPARYDDLLEVRTRVSGHSGARLRFEYEVVRDGADLLATGFTAHAAVDGRGRPRRLPATLRSVL